jgi:tetratricopeptide (TPR) repeat protein
VIGIDPAFAAAHSALGVEYAQMGRFSEAEAQLELAIALDPSWSSYYNLSLVLFQMGDWSAAQTNVRKALALSGSEAVAHLLLAYLLMPDPNKRNETESHLRFAARTNAEAARMLHRLQETLLQSLSPLACFQIHINNR